MTSPDSVGAPLSTTVRPQLMLASRGLLYTSGSDYPFVYFRRAVVNRAATTSLSIAEFRTLLGLDNDPFTGTALPTSLLGAQGVFGSLVPILRMTVTAR